MVGLFFFFFWLLLFENILLLEGVRVVMVPRQNGYVDNNLIITVIKDETAPEYGSEKRTCDLSTYGQASFSTCLLE